MSIQYAADGTVTLKCIPDLQPPPPPSYNYDYDIVFLTDSTGSMMSAISTLYYSLGSYIIPGLRSELVGANIRFGVGTFQDFPISPYGGPDCLPYRPLAPLTDDDVSVQAAINNITLCGSGDLPESGNEALYQIATGTQFSYMGFRPGSRKIVILITDALFHNDYTGFDWHSQADAVAALSASGIKVIGINIGPYADGVRESLEAFAVSTGASVPPNRFSHGGVCAIGQCCTATSGAGMPPKADGNCPLVFDTNSSGGGLGSALIQGVKSAY
jgi:hypothetical protein